MSLAARTIKQNIPQLVVASFIVLMIGVTIGATDIPLPGLISNSLVRFFMNGVLVLSLVPMLNAGVGINYGLPVGILAGLLGMCIAVDLSLPSVAGFGTAIALSVFIGSVFGYIYAKVLNRARGEEEMTGLFFGFSAVFIMSFFWAVAPFGNREMLWPIGGEGLRPTIGLQGHFLQILNNFGEFSIGGVEIPTGGILFFVALCLIMYFFSKTKSGWAMEVVGQSETFARFSGINVEQYRTLAIIISTILGAVGICVYAQSYGFLQLYDAPLMMAFPAASAILLGGSSGRNATIVFVLLGTFLFQTVYVFSGPLANALLVPEMTEIVRLTITSGVILYALLYQGRSGN